MFPTLGVAAGAMVPYAMSTFGTVIAGVGTVHAPLSAFGCAAILQASSAALVPGGAAVVGGISGAVVGYVSLKNPSSCPEKCRGNESNSTEEMR